MLKALTHIKEGPIGGSLETASLLGISLSALSVVPPISYFVLRQPSIVQAAIQIGFAALSGYSAYKLAFSALKKDRDEFVLKSTSMVESSDPPSVPFAKPGLLFGYTTDTGDAVYINDSDLTRHCLLIGQTGVGKTVLLKSLMFQQIQRGGGMLFIDGKLDIDNIRDIYEFCAYCGRPQDFLVVNPGQPELSNTYNPILFGDPDEVASRILSLIPSTAGSAGADHYKQSANLALVCFISAMQEETEEELKTYQEILKKEGKSPDYIDRSRVKGKAYNFLDLALLTMNEGVLDQLMRRVKMAREDSLTRKNLTIFLEQYSRENGMDGDVNSVDVDLKKLKDTLGGIGARMHQFGSGNFGPVLNSYSPEVKMYDSIRDSKIVYMALPTMGKNEAAQNFGKIAIADLRTAISWLQLNKEDRPTIPFIAFMDEMSSYATESLAVMFEQARSAQVALMPAIQTDSGLSNVSEDFKERILSNTETKIYFKLSSQDTATSASDLIGETKRVTLSESAGESSGQSAQALQVGPNKNASASISNTTGEREQVEPLISPDNLKNLDQGECILLRSPRVWNIRVPLIGLNESTREAIGQIRLNHNKMSISKEKTFDAIGNVDKYIDAAKRKRVKKKDGEGGKGGKPQNKKSSSAPPSYEDEDSQNFNPQDLTGPVAVDLDDAQ